MTSHVSPVLYWTIIMLCFLSLFPSLFFLFPLSSFFFVCLYCSFVVTDIFTSLLILDVDTIYVFSFGRTSLLDGYPAPLQPQPSSALTPSSLNWETMTRNCMAWNMLLTLNWLQIRPGNLKRRSWNCISHTGEHVCRCSGFILAVSLNP